MRSGLEKIKVIQRRSVFVGRERFSQYILDNQGLDLLNSLTSEQQYLSDPRKDSEEVIGVRLPKSTTETPIQMWWITKAWLELSPLGLPQLSLGLGANSGKH